MPRALREVTHFRIGLATIFCKGDGKARQRRLRRRLSERDISQLFLRMLSSAGLPHHQNCKNSKSPTRVQHSASRFPIDLPPDDEKELASETIQSDGEPLSLLLIEDNPTDVFVIEQVLATLALPIQVQAVTDGEKGLERELGA